MHALAGAMIDWDAALWVKNATDEAYASLSAAPLAYSGTDAYLPRGSAHLGRHRAVQFLTLT